MANPPHGNAPHNPLGGGAGKSFDLQNLQTTPLGWGGGGAELPHGPVCTTLDAGCPDCLRLQREAASSASAAPAAPAPAPITSDDQPDAATLEGWRSDSDRWQRTDDLPYPGREFAISCQRVATLIAALTETRAERDRAKAFAADAVRRLGTFDTRAAELGKRVETLADSLSELQRVVLGARPRREAYSSTPVEIVGPHASEVESLLRLPPPTVFGGLLRPALDPLSDLEIAELRRRATGHDSLEQSGDPLDAWDTIARLLDEIDLLRATVCALRKARR